MRALTFQMHVVHVNLPCQEIMSFLAQVCFGTAAAAAVSVPFAASSEKRKVENRLLTNIWKTTNFVLCRLADNTKTKTQNR